jgi:hypothetical protein
MPPRPVAPPPTPRTPPAAPARLPDATRAQPEPLPGQQAAEMVAPLQVGSPVVLQDVQESTMAPAEPSEAPESTQAPSPSARIQFGETNGAEPPVAPSPAEVQPTFPRAEPAPARRSFVDLSAAPCFSHTPDYREITGQVEHSRTANEWRLRFASVDESDQYGGRVALIENQHVNYLADGQFVRVRGHLVDTGEVGGSAHYRIESFEVLKDPNLSPTGTR